MGQELCSHGVFKGQSNFLKLNFKCCTHASTLRNSGKGDQIDFSGNMTVKKNKKEEGEEEEEK